MKSRLNAFRVVEASALSGMCANVATNGLLWFEARLMTVRRHSPWAWYVARAVLHDVTEVVCLTPPLHSSGVTCGEGGKSSTFKGYCASH